MRRLNSLTYRSNPLGRPDCFIVIRLGVRFSLVRDLSYPIYYKVVFRLNPVGIQVS